LTTNGSVLAWGLNDCSQTNVPAAAQSGVVAISAGAKHNLSLTTGGQVVAWGLNDCGQANVPSYIYPTYVIQGQVIAIAAGGEHSLALLGDGSVVGWGDNDDGQATGDPSDPSPDFVAVGGETLSDMVAIAAGRYHSLALKGDGTVMGWGVNSQGQATGIPNGAPGPVTINGQILSNVVAIAAGKTHSAALEADGSAVVWGSGPVTILPPQAGSNVVAIAAGDQDSLLLQVNTSAGANTAWSQSFVSAHIPCRVVSLIESCNQNAITQLALGGNNLSTYAGNLSGDKLLLTDVLELGMPYTLAHDGVLHGFLYGSESLMDSGGATNFLQAQYTLLQATPNAPPQALARVAALRYVCFTNQLISDLNALQATGQPEIPRLVGHTLRLLSLLYDALIPTTNSPPPALEMSSVSNQPSLLLYGEPYVDYTLQSCGSLTAPNWTNTAITGWQDGQTNALPFSSSRQGFYRALTVVPPLN
jgi:hypothetical protein